MCTTAGLRATCLLGMAYHPLYGTPVDPRVVDGAPPADGYLRPGDGSADLPGEKLHIPYEDTTLPGYFVRAPDMRPKCDRSSSSAAAGTSTYVENYVGIGIAALRRGYHVLLYDGPGQGRPLVDEGRPLRHDWDKS